MTKAPRHAYLVRETSRTWLFSRPGRKNKYILLSKRSNKTKYLTITRPL